MVCGYKTINYLDRTISLERFILEKKLGISGGLNVLMSKRARKAPEFLF